MRLIPWEEEDGHDSEKSNGEISDPDGMFRLAASADCGMPPPAAAACNRRPNPMHPAFKLLDAQGEMIRQGGKEPDQVRTCGQCHSTAFIAGHNLPAHQQRKVTCLSCHYEGGKANWGSEALESNGMLKREWIRIYQAIRHPIAAVATG